MLRGAVIAVGAACVLGGGVLAMVSGDGGGPAMILAGLVLIVGTIYERVRYKPLEKGAPGPGWQRTSERFIDDETGKTVTVYIRPETGERRYVEE